MSSFNTYSNLPTRPRPAGFSQCVRVRMRTLTHTHEQIKKHINSLRWCLLYYDDFDGSTRHLPEATPFVRERCSFFQSCALVMALVLVRAINFSGNDSE